MDGFGSRISRRASSVLTSTLRGWGFASSFAMAAAAWRTRREHALFFDHVVALAAREADPTPLATPFVTLVVPTFDTPPSYLNALVASVRSQRPGAAALIFSDDGSTARSTRAWLDRNASLPNVRILRHARNRGIAAASNAGVAAATTPWVGFLDHDDALAPHALDRIDRALRARPEAQLLYTDEVVADARLRPVAFHLKPAFDPVLLSGLNYLNHLSLYRRERFLALGGFREGFEGSQDYDLLLRYARGLAPSECVHLPYPAYLWRRDGASHSAQHFERASDNARRALAEAYGAPVAKTRGSLHQVRFAERERDWPLVSVIIPNRDSPALIARVLDGLLRETDYQPFEIVVIDNGTTDASVLSLYERLRQGPIPFRAVVEPERFNFARAVNKGIALARGRMILMLNNDIEVLAPDWMKEMAACFDYPDVGVVGAKLLYPNRTLQHAGVIVGFGGLAGHWWLEQQEDFPGPMGRLWVRQSMSSVTGACLMVSRAALDSIGPLDEERFAMAYNDVDLCMRAIEKGFRVVWTPFACCVHRESASRGSDETKENIDRFRREQQNLRDRHATEVYEDPAVNPWYTKDRSAPGLARLHHLPSAR